MVKILCVETSEKKCSIALSEDGVCVDFSEINEDQSHARLLTIMIQDLMDRNNLTFSNLSAVCVASGPGSYTGLRIGVSVSKGLCWASDLKLLSVTTTEVLVNASRLKTEKSFDIYLATLDARRDEVFIASFDKEEELDETKSLVLGEENPLLVYGDKKVYISGSGAEKFRPYLRGGDVIDCGLVSEAKAMCSLAYNKFLKEAFEDVAYFEPKYFKAVHTSVSKKKIFE